jgi:Transposase
MHYETGMTPSSPEAMKMDSRVPGRLCARSPGKADALCGGLTPLMKLVRLALREPKDGALEAREAKVIYVALASALCRTGVGMKQFLECSAGIDIGKREMTVTILTASVEVEPIPQMGTFGTTVQELNRCLEWLLGNHCSTVVVESTGTYWVPVWNVLHERVAVIVANSEHVKARRGEKTDPEDSRRLAERLRVGDVRGSFVPQRTDCGSERPATPHIARCDHGHGQAARSHIEC